LMHWLLEEATTFEARITTLVVAAMVVIVGAVREK